jgi:hypothetical protein
MLPLKTIASVFNVKEKEAKLTSIAFHAITI